MRQSQIYQSVLVPRCWTSAVLCILVLVFVSSLGLAENVLTEKPLVKSAVQPIKSQSDNYEMTANVAVNGYQAPQTDSLANYARGSDGQWHIPQQVDRNNPWLRLLVLGPERPLLVDIAIYVEGEPFTAAREKLIDSLLDHATVESLVRDAVSVPIPEETTDESTGKEDSEEDDSETEKSKTQTEPSESEAGDSDKESKENQQTESDAVAEDAEGEKKSSDKDEKEGDKKDPEKPMVEVKRREARSVAQRLVNYMASAEVKADREEIRWLLAEWTGGPAILTLGPAMSWQRVGFAPLWNSLDVDGDDKLSGAEITSATERLSQADVDENSIVELEELFALGPKNLTAPHSYPLAVILDHETDWRPLHSHLRTAYGRRGSNRQGSAASTTSALLTRIASGDSTLAEADLRALVDEPPDLRLRVNLGGKNKEGDAQNELALIGATSEEYFGSEKMITVTQGAQYLEISAGESQEKEASEPTATQISVGAVVDGYPLFRLVDRNGDRRLSPRECRNLKNVLTALDLDGDGGISESEKPTAIRIAITRGPHVHEMLAEPTSAEREFASAGKGAPTQTPTKDPAVEVPSWFTDMDRNRDGDVSRSEFLGTSEQFRQMDRDGDGLLGSQESTN